MTVTRVVVNASPLITIDQQLLLAMALYVNRTKILIKSLTIHDKYVHI